MMLALWLQSQHANEYENAVALMQGAALTDLLCDCHVANFAEIVAAAAAAGVRPHAWTYQHAIYWHEPAWNIRNSRGEPKDWADFTIPEAREWWADHCAALEGEHGVGVHLDYARWPDELYWDRGYMDADSITAAVEAVRAKVAGTLSTAVYSTLDEHTPGQHWRTWPADVVKIPMMYGDAERLRNAASTWPPGTVVGAAFELFDGSTGQFVRDFTPAEVLAVIAEGRAWGFEDFSFFDYEKLRDAGAPMVGALASAFGGGTVTMLDDFQALIAQAQTIQLAAGSLGDLCAQFVDAAAQLEASLIAQDDEADALRDALATAAALADKHADSIVQD